MIPNITAPSWFNAYPPNLPWEMAAVEKSAHHIFEDAAKSGPDKPCLDFLDKKFTYGEILDLVERFATGLQKMGIKKGDRIGICLPNCPYFVVAYYAILKIGAIVVNVNLLYTFKEIEQQVLNSKICTMVTLDLKLVYKKTEKCLTSTQLEKIIYCPFADMLLPIKNYLFKIFQFYQIAHIKKNEHKIAFKDVINQGKTISPVSIDPKKDIALFQYTGGTTGIPKAAMLTHSNLVSNTVQISLWLRSGNAETVHEKFLAVIPFFHVFSMTVVMNMGFYNKAEIILLPRFNLKQVLQVIDKKKPSVLAAVPAIFNAINHYKKLNKYDLTSLVTNISGGAPLPVQVKEAFEKSTAGVLVEGYGLSEASPVITCNPPHNSGKPGSIGLPLPGTEIQIRSLKDISITEGVGVPGELIARGPQIMQGYWNRDEESQETLLAGGWLRTGDIAYIDEEGYVFITDRLKDIIITNGYNVYPRVIEEAFYSHSDVSEVIVI
ncbi:AMP-binding protein, partial [Gammaproteobacteria bacterium]|nr:AMP-binding protein [Gammaproteobacteria bacterium]